VIKIAKDRLKVIVAEPPFGGFVVLCDLVMVVPEVVLFPEEVVPFDGVVETGVWVELPVVPVGLLVVVAFGET